MEYIYLEETYDTGKTKVWTVFSRRNDGPLGMVKWHGPWRQYVFFPFHGTTWNTDCLEQITAFIRGQMALRGVNKAAKEIMDCGDDCCGGEPRTSSTCETCGCREAGNASFKCAHHTKEWREKVLESLAEEHLEAEGLGDHEQGCASRVRPKRSFLGPHTCPDNMKIGGPCGNPECSGVAGHPLSECPQ